MSRLGSKLVATLLLGAGVLGLGGCGAQSGSDAPAIGSPNDVFRVTIASAQNPGRVIQTEWVQPATGSWRIRDREGRVKISTPGRYAVIDELHAEVETGSDRFLGHLRRLAVSTRPLRSYLSGKKAAGVSARGLSGGKVELRFTAGHARSVAVVHGAISSAEAAERGLFDVPQEKVTARFDERGVGAAPRQPIVAYWFGRSLGARSAVAAAERSIEVTPELAATGGWSPKDEAQTYEVFYELPEADGASSVFAGEDAPAGEIQVISQPLTTPIAQAALARFDGRDGGYPPWPLTRVTLADGTSAQVVPDRSEDTAVTRGSFAVITKVTLVWIVGGFRVDAMPALAARLRPVGL